MQGSFQIACLAVTLGLALVSGIITGYVMKLPIFEQIEDGQELFEDEPNWKTPEDFDLKLTETKGNDVEMMEKNLTTST